MYVCDRCGKGSQVGMNVSHSHRRTKKRSKPNLHKTTLFIGGRSLGLRLCTKCLRIMKEDFPNAARKVEVVPVVEREVKKESSMLSEAIQKAVDNKEKEPAEVT